MGTAIFARDVDSALSQSECEALARYAEGKTVLEVGSWCGRSTIALASTASRVHAVDWHKGDAHAGIRDTLGEFMKNLERYGVREKVIVHVGRFEAVAPFLVRAFDFAFLDSYHDRPTVYEHMRLIESLLVPGSAVSQHDYMQAMFGEAVHGGVGDWLRWSTRHWEGPVMVDSMALWSEKR